MIFEWAVRKKLFRNINHAIWFLMTMWIFIITIAYYFYPNLKVIILFPIAIHLVASIQALYLVFIKKEQSETISIDCAWYNPFMLAIYIAIYIAVNNI